MEKIMFTRKAAVAAVLSTLVFGAGAALANPQHAALPDAQPGAVRAHVSQDMATHWSVLSGGAGREEHLLADQNLAIADYLLKQGQADKAQAYLNIAHGLMGGTVQGSATGGAVQAFTPDFYNPVR